MDEHCKFLFFKYEIGLAWQILGVALVAFYTQLAQSFTQCKLRASILCLIRTHHARYMLLNRDRGSPIADIF